MTDLAYNQGKLLAATSGLTTLDVRAMLLGGASVPAGARDPDLDFVSSLLAVSGVAELTATNYARLTVTGLVGAVVDAADDATITANPLVFPNLGLSNGSEGPARALVLYKHHASGDGSRLLIAYYDTNFPKALNGNDFTVNLPDDLFTIT